MLAERPISGWVEPKTFRKKLAYLLPTLFAGIKKPVESDVFYNEIPESERTYSPPFEEMAEEVLNFLDQKKEDCSYGFPKSMLYCVPWGSYPHEISKGEILRSFCAFGDQSSVGVNRVLFNGQLMSKWIETVFSQSQDGKDVTLPEQFKIAMSLSRDNPPASLILLHGASRAIARGYDSECDPERLDFNEELIAAWRRTVPGLRETEAFYPAGDTYHLWGGALAAVYSSVRLRKRDLFFNPFYRRIYQQTALATDLLRYHLAGNSGHTHQKADEMGWELGTRIAAIMASNSG